MWSGRPCNTPTAEKLSGTGLKYTRFHTTALCSPTRQALLTGRNHHSAGMGSVAEVATGAPGNDSVRPNTVATVAELLRLNGYNTGAVGKMHQTPVWEVSMSGPFDRWPTGDGFEKFYGFVGGETNQWAPFIYDGVTPVELPDDPDYHFLTDMTDQAVAWIRYQKALTPDRPSIRSRRASRTCGERISRRPSNEAAIALYLSVGFAEVQYPAMVFAFLVSGTIGYFRTIGKNDQWNGF